MKISPQTLAVLKNFSGVNPSILIKAGPVLKTLSPMSNIMAEANIAEEFPKTFAVYDLPQFLSAISLFQDPELDFQDNFVKIGNGGRSIKYFYTDPTMVKSMDKAIKLPSVDVSFKLTEKDLGELLKAAAVLQVSELAVVSDGVTPTRVTVTEIKNQQSNDFSVEVAHQSDKAFKVVFKVENMKMIPGEYDVEVCAKGITKFTNAALGAVYFVAAEATSEFSK